MKKLFILLIAAIPALFVMGQEKSEESNLGISFSGFVKNDAFFDSRQTVNAREGHFLLWPTAETLDENGDDINAVPNFNMLALQSRLTGKISGPDAFGAKTSGVIEGDFFAQANDNINLFRLRHAFIKLNWKNTELVTGQTWNPLFVTGCFPSTVSFNTGTPLQSFARNPQIRLTQKFGGLSISGALLSQRDYTSRGPSGVSSSYLRNAGIPDLHLQLQYSSKNEETGTSYLVGAGFAYKTIVPRLSSTLVIIPEVQQVQIDMSDTTGTVVTIPAVTETYAVDEKVSGMTVIVFQTLKTSDFTFKLQGRYGENIPDVLSISGFAIKEVTDAATGERSYTPFKNLTVWTDIHTNGKNIQAGLFAGYLMNRGTKEEVTDVNMQDNVFGLGTNIESLLRVSPRIVFNAGKFRAAFEIEYTSVAFGSDYDTSYIPQNSSSISNIRALLSTYYFF